MITEKIFHPFFTTRPPGKATGLGLSLNGDIITKGHAGFPKAIGIKPAMQEGEFAELIITLAAIYATMPVNNIDLR